jgi:carboxyl-terminal processing protease
MDRIQAGKRIREQTTLSLNIDTRRAMRARELADALADENSRRLALQLEPLESLDDIDDEEVPDVQLDQAAKIVTDMATMREVNATPAQTAQVQPKSR